jgi:hypothetical protein
MWETEMMWGHESVSTTGLVCRAANVITELGQAFADDLPGASRVVALKVANVFEDYIGGCVGFQDLDNLVKESSSRSVTPPVLRARLREGLTWETRAQDIVLWNAILTLADIAVNLSVRVREVRSVQGGKLLVNLRDKDAIVP